MEVPPLPDDPRDWPTDPHALLGVSRSAGEADLKRAYTRLIRKYKPEHAPEEFRRIREAYETAVEMSRQSREWYCDATPVRDTFRDLPFTAVPPSTESTSHETQIDPATRPASDPVEAAWDDAVAGRWAEAYTALVSLAETHPQRADLPLRLYWLLALRPALDETRTRHDWLAASLSRSRLAGPAFELYRRELAADPSVALYGPYVNLLESSGADARNLLAFAAARLSAAAPESRWALLEIDLAAVAGKSADFDESEWLRYLVELAGCAEAGGPPVFDRCRELLAGLRHLELSHGWAFDMLDHRRMTRANLREARLPEPVRRALTASLAGGDERDETAAAIAWAAGEPEVVMRAFDVSLTTQSGRVFLAILARILTERGGPQVEYPPELIRQLVRHHLARNPVRDYESARASLLQFLLAERIDPEEVATACVSDRSTTTRYLIQHLREDAPLRLAYRLASATA